MANFLLWILLLTVSVEYGYSYSGEIERCEPIEIEMCSHLRYKETAMPNYLEHVTQNEAKEEFKLYSQLVNLFNCSQHINFFLCSLFVPMCTIQMGEPLVVNVCRSMCLQVKSDCEPRLSELKMPWPLNCSRLPGHDDGKDVICMEPEENWSTVSAGPSTNIPTPPKYVTQTTPVTASESPSNLSPSGCPEKYVQYDNSSCTDLCNPSCKDCIPTCDDILFTTQHKRFAYAWMAIWASLCIASTVFTVATFCVDPGRFRYPTRPIVFMAFCYFMYALAHFIPLFIPTSQIICKSDVNVTPVMIVNGMESTLCIIIFLIQYYFGIASHIWWMVLTLTWYLAASKKWSLESINSIACYFHLFAWAVPAVLTIAILVTGKVDSNELTGMCYVGNQDKWPLMVYVIIPMCFLLLAGEIFLLAGFISLLRIRQNLKTHVDSSNIRQLEKLMAKIGIFAILYTVPAVCVLGSHIHEFMNIDAWHCMSARTKHAGETLIDSIPTVEIHMLKVFMSLVIGISICMWVLSVKTLRSCEKRCCSKKTTTRTTQSRRQYRKHTSYVMAASTESNGYSQHHKFPIRHALTSNHAHSSQGDAVSL